MQEFRNWIREHQEEILEDNRQVVSFNSINYFTYGNELAAQQWMEQRLNDVGFSTESFLPTDIPGIEDHPAYLTGRNYQQRPNVVGVKKGTGQGRSLMFSGHMDTVPVGEEAWSVGPHEGVIQDGKQYGLGIYDMKAGMIAALTAVRMLDDLGYRLKGDVLLESVVDEEFGGANGTLACRLKGMSADMAIIPEPTNGRIGFWHQGGAMFRITYHGTSGRGFSGETLKNPVFAAARFVEWFKQFQQIYPMGMDQPSYVDPRYDTPPPAYIQGIKGGDMSISVFDRSPHQCSVDVWTQCYPGVSDEQLIEIFCSAYHDFAKQDAELCDFPTAEIERLIRFLPGSQVPKDHAFFDVVRTAMSKTEAQLPEIAGAALACDAFLFNLHSTTPAIIWGASGGNAHARDEYIDLQSFYVLIEQYALTLLEWCGWDRKNMKQK